MSFVLFEIVIPAEEELPKTNQKSDQHEIPPPESIDQWDSYGTNVKHSEETTASCEVSEETTNETEITKENEKQIDDNSISLLPLKTEVKNNKNIDTLDEENTSDEVLEVDKHEEPINPEKNVKFNLNGDKDSIGAKPEYNKQHSMVYLVPWMSLLERLKAVLVSLDIHNPTWTISEECKSHKVSFIEESGIRCETIIKQIMVIDVGKTDGSSISIIPLNIHYDQRNIDSLTEKEDNKPTSNTETSNILNENSNSEEESVFKKSIKARLVVNQVVQSVKSNTEFTFDYIVLVFLASLIAAVGLVENSSVVLVASMLISPLMGPIVAIVFGAVIRNNILWKLGLKVELIGLVLCILCGFLIGMIPGGLSLNGAKWASTEEFPTNEMSSRGIGRSLVVGILIALPSGAGVALSVLGGNMGSLVGVAISASLLPPAVNAGMLWSYSLLAAINPPPTVPNSIIDATNNFTENTSTVIKQICPEFVDNMYVPNFNCDMWKEAAVLGIISLLLTIVNILCIIAMGIVVFKIKEVAPMTSTIDSHKEFFHNDIKVARKSYQTHKRYDSVALYQQFLEERRKLGGISDGKSINDRSEIRRPDVKIVLRKNIQNIEAMSNVKDLTRNLNSRPFSECFNDSSVSLMVATSSKPVNIKNSTPISTPTNTYRQFTVTVTSDNKTIKEKNEPKICVPDDDMVLKELKEFDEMMRKSSVVMDTVDKEDDIIGQNSDKTMEDLTRNEDSLTDETGQEVLMKHAECDDMESELRKHLLSPDDPISAE